MRALPSLTLLLCLLTPVAAAEAPSHLHRTRAQLARVTRQSQSPDALLTQAQRAIAQAERASAQGDAHAAERALNIADAAIVLWRERQARDQARAAGAAAERRAVAAEIRAEEARQALAAIRAQRRAHDDAATDADTPETDGGAHD